MLEEFYYVSADEPTTHFRHGRRSMAAFCDGHVEGIEPAPNTWDARLPRVFVARPPRELVKPGS